MAPNRVDMPECPTRAAEQNGARQPGAGSMVSHTSFSKFRQRRGVSALCRAGSRRSAIGWQPARRMTYRRIRRGHSYSPGPPCTPATPAHPTRLAENNRLSRAIREAPQTGVAITSERVTMGQIMSQQPHASARRVFVIVDNGSDHRGNKAARRLRAAYPNCVMIHTPVHASWLNQVEIFFSIVQKRSSHPTTSPTPPSSPPPCWPSSTATTPPPRRSTGNTPPPTSNDTSPASTPSAPSPSPGRPRLRPRRPHDQPPRTSSANHSVRAAVGWLIGTPPEGGRQSLPMHRRRRRCRRSQPHPPAEAGPGCR